MNEVEDPVVQQSTNTEPRADMLEQYGCGPIRFSGTDDALYALDISKCPDSMRRRDASSAALTPILIHRATSAIGPMSQS